MICLKCKSQIPNIHRAKYCLNCGGELQSTANLNTVLNDRQTEKIAEGVNLELIVIPEGRFWMGTKSENGRTQHFQIVANPYYLCETPITQAQYRAVMQINPAKYVGANNPVEQVTYYDVMLFCQRLSDMSGKKYRLPSESEWEYACRAGTETDYHTGDSLDKAATYDTKMTQAVRQYAPNSLGFYAMHGNVWEWCIDAWAENYRGTPFDGAPRLNSLKTIPRVIRGGSFRSQASNCKSSSRSSLLPTELRDDVGFRVVMEI
jgi:formylglycine-generating enzyme required for sulfatase activity